MKPEKYDLVFYHGEPPRAGIYDTKRNSSSHITSRYWDGEKWWGITTQSACREVKNAPSVLQNWSRNGEHYMARINRVYGKGEYVPVLRTMSDQAHVEWALPKAVYSDKQILDYLDTRGSVIELMSKRFNEPTGCMHRQRELWND